MFTWRRDVENGSTRLDQRHNFFSPLSNFSRGMPWIVSWAFCQLKIRDAEVLSLFTFFFS
jgi:hypothetical protein